LASFGQNAGVARPALGERPVAQTRAALYAYILSRLEGATQPAQAALFRSLNLPFSPRSARRAGEPLLHKAGKKSGALREWLLVDEHELGLEKATVRFPGAGERQQELLNALSQVAGVRQIIELERSFDILAIVVFQGRAERLDLQARLAELTPQRIWEDITSETSLPTVLTWRARTAAAAQAEGF
jgi:hypothetical protein